MFFSLGLSIGIGRGWCEVSGEGSELVSDGNEKIGRNEFEVVLSEY